MGTVCPQGLLQEAEASTSCCDGVLDLVPGIATRHRRACDLQEIQRALWVLLELLGHCREVDAAARRQEVLAGLALRGRRRRRGLSGLGAAIRRPRRVLGRKPAVGGVEALHDRDIRVQLRLVLLGGLVLLHEGLPAALKLCRDGPPVVAREVVIVILHIVLLLELAGRRRRRGGGVVPARPPGWSSHRGCTVIVIILVEVRFHLRKRCLLLLSRSLAIIGRPRCVLTRQIAS
mmetsp:Transcript_34393/g.88174  ORF Transcript_34393/g.88174 Transcript_34393/m.88174 type:complete len:233 (-) Transcript_34393:1105-1803(-)